MRKKLIFIILIAIIFSFGYYILFMRSGPVSQGRVIGEIIQTEEVQCNNETYVFEMVLTKDKTAYFNNIYKDTNTADNFIASIKALPRGGNVFFVLGAPRENCDRIYLTVALYETDAPLRGIFEWKTSGATIRELAIGENFRTDLVAQSPNYWRNAVSSDGDSIIVAQANKPFLSENFCHLQTLLLLHLIKDESNAVVKLSDKEMLSQGEEGGIGGCPGMNFGWVDDSTIYYDVYGTTADHPLLERRMLKIN